MFGGNINVSSTGSLGRGSELARDDLAVDTIVPCRLEPGKYKNGTGYASKLNFTQH